MPQTAEEKFKPIPISTSGKGDWKFALRRIIDLQLERVSRVIIPFMNKADGKVLDVGAGEMPWRNWIQNPEDYLALDIQSAGEFGMQSNESIVYYDGGTMPFEDGSFPYILCSEVLEHATDPQLLLNESFRVLSPGGKLCLTVPWSARMHHLPHDFHRFTIPQLEASLTKAGFSEFEILSFGNTYSVVFNKLLIDVVSDLSQLATIWLPLCLLKLLITIPLTGLSWILHFLLPKTENRSDPLGFCILARKQ